jgi:glycosyltransferase involved in cell wall biosynthesis
MVIGVVSALRPEKGLLTLVEAFARIRRLRRNLKLAIVGSGPMLEALRSRAQELSITADCLFQPATIEVAAWLRAIDIFVLPSHSEGLSNSLMEAMACGCCCVASEVGGNPELIGANARGLLFRAEDTGDLAGALQRLVSNADLRRTLAQQASQFLHARFSLASSAECMGEIYHRLLANRG